MSVARNAPKVRLGDVSKIFQGVPAYRLRGMPGGMFPVVSVSSLSHVGDAGWPLPTVPVQDAHKLDAYRLRPNDVVVTARGTSFNAALVPKRWAGAVLHSNLIAIRTSERLRPELLLVHLLSSRGRQAIERRLAGSSLLLLTTHSLAELEITILPTRWQSALADLATSGRMQYEKAMEAAQLRREIVDRIVREALHTGAIPEGAS